MNADGNGGMAARRCESGGAFWALARRIGCARIDVKHHPFRCDQRRFMLTAPTVARSDSLQRLAILDDIAAIEEIMRPVVEYPRDRRGIQAPEVTLEVGHSERSQSDTVHHNVTGGTVFDAEQAHVPRREQRVELTREHRRPNGVRLDAIGYSESVCHSAPPHSKLKEQVPLRAARRSSRCGRRSRSARPR